MQLVCVAACVERVSGVAVCVVCCGWWRWSGVGGGGGGVVKGVMRFWYWRRMRVESGCKKKMQFVCVASWCRRVYDRSIMAEPAGVGVCVLCKKMSAGGDESCASMSNLKNEREKRRRMPHRRNKMDKKTSNWVVLMMNEKNYIAHNMSCNLSASDLGAGMSTTVGRAGVCMCGVLIDNEKKRHVVQFVCVRSWGRHVYDSGSRECVCVYMCVWSPNG